MANIYFMKKQSRIIFSLMFSFALLVVVSTASIASAQTATSCSSTAGYNTVNGTSCNGQQSTVPIGCSSTTGFSSNNGMPCNNMTASANNYGGSLVGQNGYLDGCNSIVGYSATTGMQCNLAVNGVIYTGNGTTVSANTPVVTYPGQEIVEFPTTGAGQNALMALLVLLTTATAIVLSTRYLARTSFSK